VSAAVAQQRQGSDAQHDAHAVNAARRRLHGSGFWAVAFAFLVVMAVATLPSPLYGLYRTRDHLSTFVITLVYAIFAGGTIITLLGDRFIVARIGRRGMMLGGVAAMMVAVGVLAAWKDLPGLFIGRLLTGVAVGLAAGVAIPYLIELRLRADPSASAARARNIGTAINVGALGIGPLIAGCLAEWAAQPLTLSYLIFAALGAVALIGVAAAPETGAPASRAATQGRPAGPRRQVRLPVPAAAATIAAFSATACSPGCPGSSWPPRSAVPHTRCPAPRCSWCSRPGWCPSWPRPGCEHRARSPSAWPPRSRVWCCSLSPSAFPHPASRCS
jgi:MFS family permease